MIEQLLVSPVRPVADETKNAPEEFCEIEQIEGVEVVNVTASWEVAWALNGTIDPKVAVDGGVKEIDCDAYAPGCGVIIPEIVTAVESCPAMSELFPVKPTVIWQLPFHSALMIARV